MWWDAHVHCVMGSAYSPAPVSISRQPNDKSIGEVKYIILAVNILGR